MEYFGLIAFILVLSYSSYPSKLKKLEKEVQTLKRSMRGENAMSKLINDLKGQKCLITSGDAVAFVGKTSLECEIIDVDDEWVKIAFVDRKGIIKTVIMRIENIENIELKETLNNII